MMLSFAKSLLYTIFIVLLTSPQPSSPLYSSHRPRVTTPSCKYVGKTHFIHDIPVDTYLGIPFARPPIGDLRFRKPLPPLNCTKPLQADHLGPACVQSTPTPFPWRDPHPGKSMDCLYLNVWAPPPSPIEKKAVMVFLHGGGFRIGSNRLDYQDGRAMAALGDVVVVVPNYRLGTEGFLYLGTEDAPGNMGLHDILAALRWVRRNIGHFGGDRDRVTLFGQSAGAIAISMLMTSPLSEGLFARAALHSGSAANLDAEDNGRDGRLSRAVAEEVGCWPSGGGDDLTPDDAAGVADCLRGKDALELAKTVSKVSDNPQRGLYPRYGDEILPENVREALLRGKFRDMPILMGHNANEGATMITKVYKDVFGFHGHKDSLLNKTAGEEIIRKNFRSFKDVDLLLEHYLGDVKDEDVRHQVQSASGDYARVCPSVFLSEAVSARGNPVFYYVFEHRPSPSPFAPWMGVVHFDETPFVFGYPLRYPEDYTYDELILSFRMLQVWTNFAKYGLPWMSWPLFSRSNPNYVEISGNSSYIRSTPSENCDFFRPYFGFD